MFENLPRHGQKPWVVNTEGLAEKWQAADCVKDQGRPSTGQDLSQSNVLFSEITTGRCLTHSAFV
jgi:hypothetical protein